MSALPAPVVVGVFPASALAEREALFAALAEAFPVRFEGRGDGELSGLDGVIAVGSSNFAKAAAETGVRALALLVPEGKTDLTAVAQELSDLPELDHRLRSSPLPDAWLSGSLQAGASLGEVGRASVLASCGDRPTWSRAGLLDLALLAPAELEAGEALRERLCDGRSAALLPLACFLRELTAAIRWQPAPARACLLFDDPNLHRPAYGFLDLLELAGHAREHGYHAALATVPLDGWHASAGARRALAESAGAISLLVHGNDHNGGELGRQATEREGLQLAAQALRRIDAFQRRTGIAVDRVMVPPHELCSEEAALGLLRSGFEAITMTRPFPWLSQPPRSWLSRPDGAGPLVGWHPADFAGQLPVILRHPLLTRDAPELVLRAFLDQPLILYGHHEDVAGGLGVLADAARDVNRLGETRWCSVGEIAAANFETRRDGATLAVRPYTRRLRVEIPEGTGQLLLELPAAHPGPGVERLTVDGEPAQIGEPIEVRAGSVAELRLHATSEADPAAVPAPRRQPLALARRALGEGRDRLLPLVDRLR
ncbi:MAG TPA: hypothetical protein VFS48_01920 [Solirubrobacterales bacterium]|nr:hypothetical protein [Solirubrobacterales bacterium]